MRQLYFVSNNINKYEELKYLLKDKNIELKIAKKSIKEYQIDDPKELIKEKAKQAFLEVRRPVIVEHAALKINAFGNLPGLQTAYFYCKFGAEKIVDYCRKSGISEAIVESYVCICDGKNFYFGEGYEKGNIISHYIRKNNIFDWDEIFIPSANNPEKLTYAQMGAEMKNQRSMRKLAIDNIVDNNSDWWNQFQNEELAEENMDELINAIREKKVMLFIGAGISASVGFDSWNNLLKKLGEKCSFDGDLFATYGDNMLLAEYAYMKKEKEISEWLYSQFEINEETHNILLQSEIYDLIYKLDCPVIYTTNYDHLIEEYYEKRNGRNFKVIKNLDDMRELKGDTVRIMKFHGDIDFLKTEGDIVLSESEYFKRMNFQHFMDIQLQADMQQHHVLFLGYSLSDINMKLLLYLSQKRRGESTWNSYIYTATPNQVQKAVFQKNNIISFSGEEADKKAGTEAFLKKLVSSLDV